MTVRPTDRSGLSPDVPAESAAGAGAEVSGAGAGGVPGGTPAAPFFAGEGVPLAARGRAIFFALSSVTMISPCCSAAALSSMLFRASDQVCPAALQAQDGLNSWR